MFVPDLGAKRKVATKGQLEHRIRMIESGSVIIRGVDMRQVLSHLRDRLAGMEEEERLADVHGMEQ